MSTTLLSRRPVVDAITRRWLLGGMGGHGVLAALPGCAPAPGGAAPAAAARIEHRFGTAELPADPQRVVTVGFVEQDALLALGVVPVGATEFFGGHRGAVHPWARAALGDAPVPEVLTTTDDIPFERIAALAPDLILAVHSGITRADHDRLSAIAPTVAPPPGSVDFGVSWQELTRTVGTAVGRGERAAELVAEIEDRMAA